MYSSKLDLRSGHWQVESDEAGKHKPAFSVENMGFFECNRVAVGLTNATSTFQRPVEHCMSKINLNNSEKPLAALASSIKLLRPVDTAIQGMLSCL